MRRLPTPTFFTGFTIALTFLGSILPASPPQTRPKLSNGDFAPTLHTSPSETLQSLRLALAQGDLTAARACFTGGTAATAEERDLYIKFAVLILHDFRVAVADVGDDGRTIAAYIAFGSGMLYGGDKGYELEKAADRARMFDKDNPADEVQFIRSGDSWLIDESRFVVAQGADGDAERAKLKRDTDAMAELVAAVRSGKYAKAMDAVKALPTFPHPAPPPAVPPSASQPAQPRVLRIVR
jgi:hypothetical protein